MGRREAAHQFILQQIDGLKKIVELGCNNHKRRIKDKRIIGVDVKKEYQPDIVWDINEGLPFKYGELDAIVGVDIVEHIKDPYKLLFECCRVLKKGGKIVFIIPRADVFGYKILNKKEYGHKFMWSKDDWCRLVKNFRIKYLSPINDIKAGNMPGKWFFYFISTKS